MEISSGLLGRHNVYNSLAAVAVGIAVGAPLDDIVKGIEEVDAIPGITLARLLDIVREYRAQHVITGNYDSINDLSI